MSKRDDTLLIDDILNAFRAIQEYTASMTYNDFLKNRMCADAVIRNFEIVGEASKNVSKHIKNQHPEIEWQKMVDFRNRLIHNYFGISYPIVWQIITDEVPQYIALLKPLI